MIVVLTSRATPRLVLRHVHVAGPQGMLAVAIVVLAGCGARTGLDMARDAGSEVSATRGRDGGADSGEDATGERRDGGSDAAADDGGSTIEDGGGDGSDAMGSYACGPAAPRFDGPLCGPPSLPCRILADEVVNAEPTIIATPAAIALDLGGSPHLLYQRTEGAFRGFYASREAARSWRIEAIPPPLLVGSLVIDSDSTPYALVESGLGVAMSLWRRDMGGWEHVDDLGAYSQLGGTLLRSASGCLHAAVAEIGGDPHPVYGRRAETGWTFERLPPPVHEWGTTRPSIAIAPSGEVSFAYHFLTDRGRELWWADSDASAERIASDPGPAGGASPLIAVTEEPDGRHVYVFHVPRNRSGDLGDLLVSMRSPTGTWSDVVVDTWPPDCTGADTSCMFTPYVALASGPGDVRLLYVLTQFHRFGTTAELRLASVSRGRVDRATVLPTAPGGAGSLSLMVQAAVDAAGRMHIAVVSAVSSATESAVRYLLLGP